MWIYVLTFVYCESFGFFALIKSQNAFTVRFRLSKKESVKVHLNIFPFFFLLNISCKVFLVFFSFLLMTVGNPHSFK